MSEFDDVAATHDLIDAFADGERVDPQALKVALADAAARDYLVDLLALRGLVHDHISLDTTTAAAPAAPSPARFASAAWLRATAAIAILGVAASAGFLAGRRGHDAAPPIANAAIVAPPSAETLAAPEPTHVIQLQPGVEWRERAGGH
jgi:hypothetical protein